jgi:predicted dehydrogenase
MKNKKIRWGIIGLGKIANKFASDLATQGNAELVAVASRSAKNAAEFAQKYQANKAYDSYEELAKDVDVDAVYIATPHSFHKMHSILCLQNKKAVLCEKPLAMNLEEVTEMIDVAQENNVLLMEAMWTAFLPHFSFVLELVKDEKYGKLKSLAADFGFYSPYNVANRLFKKEVGGGSLLDIGIYPIFAAIVTLGRPDKIAANATFFENGADSSCAMTFYYKDATAVLKSTLLAETPTDAVFTFERAQVKINRQFHSPTSLTVCQNENVETINFPCSTIGYNFEISHFNDLLLNNKKESPILTYNFSKDLIKTIDEVRKIIDLSY